MFSGDTQVMQCQGGTEASLEGLEGQQHLLQSCLLWEETLLH